MPSPCPCAVSFAAVSTDSLEKKPASGGRPAPEASAIAMVNDVTGSKRRSPPILDIRLEPTLWITTPAARNASALNAACTSRWKTAAERPPQASAPIMYASWLTVPYASTRLMSSCTRAANAAPTIEIADRTPSRASTLGAPRKIG